MGSFDFLLIRPAFLLSRMSFLRWNELEKIWTCHDIMTIVSFINPHSIGRLTLTFH